MLMPRRLLLLPLLPDRPTLSACSPPALAPKPVVGLPAGAPGSPRPKPTALAPKRRGDRWQAAGCANCGCESTCLWRRDKFEPMRTLCNACGIYKATNGVDRLLSGRFPARRHGRLLLVKRTVRPRTGLLLLLRVRVCSRRAADYARSRTVCRTPRLQQTGAVCCASLTAKSAVKCSGAHKPHKPACCSSTGPSPASCWCQQAHCFCA